MFRLPSWKSWLYRTRCVRGLRFAAGLLSSRMCGLPIRLWVTARCCPTFLDSVAIPLLVPLASRVNVSSLLVPGLRQSCGRLKQCLHMTRPLCM